MATVTGTNNCALQNKYGPSVSYPVAANTVINQTAAVCLDSSGNANPGADTSGFVFVGIAELAANNNPGVAGAVSVITELPVKNPLRQFNAVSPTQASWVGKRVFLSDDNTVTLAAGSTNKVIVGTCVSVDQTGAAGVITVDLTNKAALATT